MARYQKCLPSGRKNGQRCEVCWAASIFVTATGVPPLVLTRIKGAMGLGENRITPSAPQAPPRPKMTSASDCAEPPLISIVFSLFSAKKPSDRLSGDQKGKIAPSVSASARASKAFTGRTQMEVFPSVPMAAKAMDKPSGDNTGGPAPSPVKLNEAFSGGLMTVRT